MLGIGPHSSFVLVMAALRIAGADIIFLSCGYLFLSFFFFFSSPNLSRRRLDYTILPHMVWS